MRRFKFRLQTVLNHRETIERLREQDFATASGILRTLEAKLEALREEFRRILQGRPGSKSGEAFDPSVILDRERYLKTLEIAIAEAESRVSKARVVVEQTRQELVRARQAREAVTRLREKEHAAYLAEQLREEQTRLDEIATMRHVRAQKERVA